MTRTPRKHTQVEPLWLMPALDAALVFLAYLLAYVVRYQLQILRPVGEFFSAPFSEYIPYAVVFTAMLYFAYRGGGLYATVRARAWSEELYGLINGVAGATMVLFAVSFVLQPLVFSRLMLIYVAVFTLILHVSARLVRRIIYARLRARGVGVQRAVVIGAGDTGRSVLRLMIARKELGYVPLGYLDDDPARGNVDLGRVRGLGSTDNLAEIIEQYEVDAVVITLPWSHHDKIVKLVDECQHAGIEVSIVPDVFQLSLQQVQIENIDGIPLLRINGPVPFKASSRLVKRGLDITLVILAAPLWLPLLGIVAAAIRIEGEGSIFYRAKRVGENGRIFDLLKFRSMVPNAETMHADLVKAHEQDPRHPKIKDDPRVTKVGHFIRRTSLDELPNLLNVLSGQLSLVGPRPPTPEEVSLYAPWHRQRLQVKPGMTGLWQVSGRSDVPFDEMCLLDIYYIENWSMGLDARILMMTIPRVILRQGAY